MSLKYRNKETGQVVEVVDAGYRIDEDVGLEERMKGPDFVNWPVTVFFKANGIMQFSRLKADFLKNYERVREEHIMNYKKEYRHLRDWLKRVRPTTWDVYQEHLIQETDKILEL